jgi:hypothetical protein
MREMALRDLGRPKFSPKRAWYDRSSVAPRGRPETLNRKARIAQARDSEQLLRTCLDCPVSTGKFELFPISHASGLARPLSKWLKRPCRPGPAYVESRGGWAPSGRGHRHCAAACQCATRRRELHCSTELPAPIRPLSRPPRCQHALVVGVASASGVGVRHHAALEAGGPRVRGTDHARVGFQLVSLFGPRSHVGVILPRTTLELARLGGRTSNLPQARGRP